MTTSAVGTPTDPATLVGSMIDAVTDSLTNVSFVAEGQFLLGAITLIALTLLGIKSMLAHDTFADSIGNLVTIVLLWGLASWIIGTGYGGVQFIPSLNAGFDLIAAKILDGTSFPATLGRMLHAAVSMFEGDTTAAETGLWDAVTSAPATLATLLFKVFAALFIVVASLLYAGQYLVTQFMIYIGGILAPIFVPWLLFKPTQFLFEGWLKFMIVAGLQKVIGATMLMASAGIIEKANNLAVQAGSEAAPSFYIYAVVMLVMGIMAYLMSQATGTAQALMSGGMNMGKFNAPSKLTAGGAANAASGSMQKMGEAAGRAGSVAAAGVAGGLAAASSAASAGRGAGSVIGSAATGFGSGVGSAAQARSTNPASAARTGMRVGAGTVTRGADTLRSQAGRSSQAASAALSTGRTSMSTGSGQWRAATASQGLNYQAAGHQPAAPRVAQSYAAAYKAARRTQAKSGDA